MRRAFRHVMRCFATGPTLGGGVSAVLAVAALTAFGSAQTASGAESARGLHVISMGAVDPEAIVLGSDGTPWFTASDDVVHVAADGRVVKYHLPLSEERLIAEPAVWGADGALWEVEEAINGLIRVAPDGRTSRFRDVWATRQTRVPYDEPLSLIVGPDGRFWLESLNRILSVAPDSPARVVATLGERARPDLLATGPDGSVWFTDDNGFGLRRVLPDGRVETTRYRNSEIGSATVAASGDVWITRWESTSDDVVKRAALVRIDRGGGVTEFRAPRLDYFDITTANEGVVWTDGLQPGTETDTGVDSLVRRDATGRFERIFRASDWLVDDIRAAPDGRLWLVYQNDDEEHFAAWLPPNPCLSRRRITVHPHSRRGDPIRSVRLSVQGRFPRIFHGRRRSIPIDLRGYLPGAVGVTLKIRTAHRRRTRHLVFHTCRFAG
jgi:virginiamycin B lyase